MSNLDGAEIRTELSLSVKKVVSILFSYNYRMDEVWVVIYDTNIVNDHVSDLGN